MGAGHRGILSARPAFTVDWIAEDGEVHRREVDPDLVLATRLELDLDEGGALEALHHAPARDGARRLGVLRTGHAAPPAVPLSKQEVDDAAGFARLAAHDRRITAVEPVGAHDADQRRARLRREREGQGPGRVAVQAVHHADIRAAWQAVGRPLAQSARRRVLAARVGAGWRG